MSGCEATMCLHACIECVLCLSDQVEPKRMCGDNRQLW